MPGVSYKMKFRRRKFIINAGLQMKIALVFVAIAISGSIAATAAFNYFAQKKIEKLMWSTHIGIKNTGEIIKELVLYVNLANFLFIAVLLIIAVVWMMKKTRGPIFRITKDIEEVSNGDLTIDIILRDKDEFRDAAHELNLMVGSMREKFMNLIEKQGDISGSIDELKIEIDDPASAVRNYNIALENIRKFEEEISSFKLEKSE